MKFDKPKGQRLHKQFLQITNFQGLWWVPALNKWTHGAELNGHSYQSGKPCRSLRAFRRHLKYHPEIRGKAMLVSEYIGFNVYG